MEIAIDLARITLTYQPFVNLEKIKTHSRNADLLPSDRWLAVPDDLVKDEAFFKEICHLETSRLLVPERFAPEGGKGRLKLGRHGIHA